MPDFTPCAVVEEENATVTNLTVLVMFNAASPLSTFCSWVIYLV